MSTSFHVHWRRVAGTVTAGMLVAGGAITWLNMYEDQEIPRCSDETTGICEGAPLDVIEQSAAPVQNSETDWTQGLPPCAQEDSDNCYWDAANMGNGKGKSFVTIDGTTTYEDGTVVTWDEPATEPWVQPCTSYIADHGGICKGEPIDWPYSNAETLVCGHDAKPALDYREDVGWWAYCEPALVEGEK